jgi:hypothetical protein
MVMDPTHKNEIFRYEKSIQWLLVSDKDVIMKSEEKLIKEENQMEFA